MQKTNFIENFMRIKLDLHEVQGRVEHDLRSLLEKRQVKFHSVTGRVKSTESLVHKVARPERNYKDLFEITDLVAFRIVVYSEDLIAEVARLIEKNFEIDLANSNNRLVSTESDRFGYRSLHYVCKLPKKTLAMSKAQGTSSTKNPGSSGQRRPLKNPHSGKGQLQELCFEIQIRTILQHAWAEIEHDLGYKAGPEFSGKFRRNFSQLASLLEIADRDFASLREEILQYQRELQMLHQSAQSKGAAKRRRWAGSPKLIEISLDQFSVHKFIHQPEIIRLDKIISEVLRKPISKKDFFPTYLLQALNAAGIEDLKALKAKSKISDRKFREFLRPYFKFTHQKWNFNESSIEKIDAGYAILFVSHICILDGPELLINKVERLANFYQKLDHPDEPRMAKQVAEELVSELALASWFK